MDIAAEGLKAFARISDQNGKLLKELNFGLAQAKVSTSVQVRAGEAIRITLGGRTPEDTGFLKITLVEVNQEEGEKKINKAMREAQSLLVELELAKKAGDHEKSHELMREALAAMAGVPACKQSLKAMEFVREKIGAAGYYLGDYESAERAWIQARQYYEETFHPDNTTLQYIRTCLATLLLDTGKCAEARPILEEVIEVLERTVDPDDMLLQLARRHLALPLKEAGEIEAARDLLKKVMGVYERKLPAEAMDLQIVRINLAHVLMWLGGHVESKEMLEKVVDILERTRPVDDLLLQDARLNLACVLRILGNIQKASTLAEKALNVYEKSYPPDHITLTSPLFELAAVKHDLGDFHEARKLYERVLKIKEQVLEPSHPDIMRTRMALGNVMLSLGDPWGARELIENTLGAFERIYFDDHQDVQIARVSMGKVLYELDEYREARKYLEKAIAVYELTHPSDHPLLQNARIELGRVFCELKNFQKAKELMETALWNFEQSDTMDVRSILAVRQNLALVYWDMGDLDRALTLLEEDHGFCERELPKDHMDLQISRNNLAAALMVKGRRAQAADLIREAVAGGSRILSRTMKTGSIREIGQSLRKFHWILNHYLTLGLQGSFIAKDSFEAAETFRAAGARAGRIIRIMADHGGEEIALLQKRLLENSLDMASARGPDFYDAVRMRDLAAIDLSKAVMKLPQVEKIFGANTPEEIVAKLPEGWAAVSYLRYKHLLYPEKGGTELDAESSYLVFILHPGGKVDRLSLGNAEDIDRAVQAWREELEQSASSDPARQAGRRLRLKIWDPIRQQLGDVRKIAVAPDSAVTSVPFEALPDKDGVLADEYTISYLDALSTLALDEERAAEKSGVLVAFGDINFNKAPRLYQTKNQDADRESVEEDPPRVLPEVRPVFRSGRGANVPLLEYTGIEARMVSDLYRKVYEKDPIFLKDAEASKDSLIVLAPRARFLHIATHGYHVKEQFKSSYDPTRDERDHIYSTADTRVRGLAPSLLCGLMFAGCNRPLEGHGDTSVISAEEIQGLDLSCCELAVLSACETNVGIVRAGQGTMSMQRALGIAGVRGSITSLWKVDDTATCLLFMEFYRLFWEENLPPVEALRQAKFWLRNLTADEIEALIDRIPLEQDRSLLLKRSQAGQARHLHPFAWPRYWASFVYWGSLE